MCCVSACVLYIIVENAKRKPISKSTTPALRRNMIPCPSQPHLPSVCDLVPQHGDATVTSRTSELWLLGSMLGEEGGGEIDAHNKKKTTRIYHRARHKQGRSVSPEKTFKTPQTV